MKTLLRSTNGLKILIEYDTARFYIVLGDTKLPLVLQRLSLHIDLVFKSSNSLDLNVLVLNFFHCNSICLALPNSQTYRLSTLSRLP